MILKLKKWINGFALLYSSCWACRNDCAIIEFNDKSLYTENDS